jgi:hypothetical protein
MPGRMSTMKIRARIRVVELVRIKRFQVNIRTYPSGEIIYKG